ncbi:zinc transport system permease protein [Halobacillus karajensis]|uniref:Zinc transport system permease protein AdcB n=1 Tax=Halobacillus karajensis TaxID=195088 RepID=A0A024P6U8_9BACI|nr:metal ABC transporter permease [Halobacillus karajensis]CDQ20464.1 putative zinc transport system permease protein AdcB [Halobacillus karajensis]CDQ24067.1 putative zinc transport system permease protein AdcB [Halobacillus karajensis]CDQ27545.1 putative zinc transport system permease protein AdcB [Halobacillus karajensis]SEH91302.1 zinc transport system permease protein [Halobacillus karajensis]
MINNFFQYEFLQNAAITGVLIGIVAPLLGVFIVVRRLSLIADALSHITLTGIAASLLLEKKVTGINEWNPIYLGMAFSVVGAILIERLRKVYKHYEELAIPIILSGGIGTGVILISLAEGFNTDLFSYLFGSVTAVSRDSMWTVLMITSIVIVIVILFYKELFVLSFDEEHASVSGVNGRWIHLLFIVMVALVIASSMQVVGILLVSALMTLPVASAIRIAKSFKQTIGLSIAFGETSVLVGLISSYHLSVPPGGTIVVTAILILIMSILYKRVQAQQWMKGEA